MTQPQTARQREEMKPNRPSHTGNDSRHGSQTDQLGGFVDRAKDAAAGMAQDIGGRATGAVQAVGSGMESLADSIRERAPREGVLGTASGEVARTLESGGRYLREEGLSGMMDDLTSVIRKNPLPAVLIGIGLGFLLARTTSRS